MSLLKPCGSSTVSFHRDHFPSMLCVIQEIVPVTIIIIIIIIIIINSITVIIILITIIIIIVISISIVDNHHEKILIKF